MEPTHQVHYDGLTATLLARQTDNSAHTTTSVYVWNVTATQRDEGIHTIILGQRMDTVVYPDGSSFRCNIGAEPNGLIVAWLLRESREMDA